MSEVTIGGEVLCKRDVRERAKKSLYYFAKAVCGKNKLAAHLHKPFANFISLHPWHDPWRGDAPWETLRKVTWLPRDHYKSTVCSEAFPLWLLIHDPNRTILLLSAKEENTAKWLSSIKSIINSPYFRWAFGDVVARDPNGKWDQNQITIKREIATPQASITASSIKAGLASQHYDYIILDDPVDEQVARSAAEMETAVWLFLHLEEILKDWDTSGLLLVGTPWGREDVLAEALKHERPTEDAYGNVVQGSRVKWGVGALGEFHISDALAHRDELLPKVTPGKPILPSVCNERRLEEIKKQSIEKLHFQYLCKPYQEGQNGFRLNKIREFAEFPDGRIHCDCHPSHKHHLSEMAVVIVSDPAYTEDKNNCESSILVGAKAPCGCRFLLYEWGDFVTTDKYIAEACDIAQKHMPWLRRFGVETVNFQTALKSWLITAKDKGEFPLNIEFWDLKPRKRDKDARIASQVTPVTHGLWHRRATMEQNHNPDRPNLLEQLYRWPYSRKRDRADAFGYFDDCWGDLSPTHIESEGERKTNINDELYEQDMRMFIQESYA